MFKNALNETRHWLRLHCYEELTWMGLVPKEMFI